MEIGCLLIGMEMRRRTDVDRGVARAHSGYVECGLELRVDWSDALSSRMECCHSKPTSKTSKVPQ